MPTVTTDPLNALLAIRDGYSTARWNFADAVNTSVTSPGGIGNAAALTFSFRSSVPAYLSTTGFTAFSAPQQQATRDVLSSISGMVRLNFTETSAIGDITFGMHSQSGGAGYAYYPAYSYSYSGSTITSVQALDAAGDVWLNSGQTWTASDFLAGGSGYGTLVHELGHALGLKHPFAATSTGYTLASSLNTRQYTVMSYTEHPHSLFRTVVATASGYTSSYEYIQPETLMPLDISALQYLYGANTTSHAGNDTYTFDTARPFIRTIWDGGGIDTISVANFTLGCVIDLRPGSFSSIRIPSDPLPAWATETHTGIYDGTDNLAIAYGVSIENAVGGSGNDHLTGNTAANVLSGGGGADTMNGGAGADTLNGGTGTDSLNGETGADSMIGGDGSDTYFVDNTGDVVTETNASASTGGADTVYSYLATYSLGANIENGRILASGAADLGGNSLNNVLYASAGNNVLNGNAGADTADYRYAGSAITVSLAISTAQTTGGSGTDTLTAIENLTGSNYNDTLTGNASANILDGGAGTDAMLGGDGADIYHVRDLGDTVSETNPSAATGGSDTVYSYLSTYTLGANVENGRILTTTAANLTGNTLNNVLYAGTGNNALDGGTGTDTVSYAYGVTGTTGVTVSLALGTAQATGGSGSDTLTSIENLTGSSYADNLTGNIAANVLDGGAGVDTMAGGDGNDTYYVRNIGDIVTETNAASTTGGTDFVHSYLSTYTLTSNVENGRILATTAANLTGNTLNNVLYAGTGNNVINGGTGTDIVSYAFGVTGATGVTISLALNTAQTTGGSGSDTLVGIENLTGSTYNDALTGSSGANVLNGGAGNDSLSGGLGLDTFRFDTALNAVSNLDTISDFSVADDTLQLENAIFTSLTATGVLAAGLFRAGAGITTAADANDYLIYNSSTGALYYDADANSINAAVRFATLAPALALTTADFVVS